MRVRRAITGLENYYYTYNQHIMNVYSTVAFVEREKTIMCKGM